MADLEFYRDELGNACARGRDDRLATFLQTDLQDAPELTRSLIQSLKSESSHAEFNGNGHSVSIAPMMVVIESNFDDEVPDRRLTRSDLLVHLEAWLTFISAEHTHTRAAGKNKKKTAAYGSWPSQISAELMVAESVGLSQAMFFDSYIYWLESRPQEQGRSAIVYRDMLDEVGEKHELLPARYNCRTQVHEYGGACYLPTSVGVFFVNQADQQIYLAKDSGDIKAITRETGRRFADFAYDENHSQLVAIAEHHDKQLPEPRNSLVAVSLDSGVLQTLHSGEDFYASARFSADGEQLCWLSWNHPNMPWDGTNLWLAKLSPNRVQSGTQLVDEKIIAGGVSESVFQPEWSPQGDLFFVSDKSNWWNIYQWKGGQAVAICPMEVEFGMPQWAFGMSRYGFIDDTTIVSSFTSDGSESLARIDTVSGELTEIPRPHSSYHTMATMADKICYIAQSPTSFPALYVAAFDPAQAGPAATAEATEQLVCASSTISIAESEFSHGENLTFPTAGDATAHGVFYPPASAEYTGPADELPPLIVMIHGGPTSATQNDLSLKIQFWTNRGFAVLDVNYRGSTGFGRHYRDALKTRWGVADVEDCDHGVRYLVDRNLVDGDRVAIRGGSAGGYTALAALAMTDTFKAGASLYGVTDLSALAGDTHKFESRYLDSLIGPYPQDKALYDERSPINQVGSINCPVIFLQGLDDKVVPPDQAESMIDVLLSKGVKVAYVPFEGEAHGFRKSQNICKAFAAELWFYGEVFGFGAGSDDFSFLPGV